MHMSFQLGRRDSYIPLATAHLGGYTILFDRDEHVGVEYGFMKIIGLDGEV